MSDDELDFRRIFRAPRELVWRCLTEPVELAQFWGPRGTTTPIDGIIVELHAGGRFEGGAPGHRASQPLVGIRIAERSGNSLEAEPVRGDPLGGRRRAALDHRILLDR